MDYKNKYEQALERARIWKDKSGMPKDKQGILDDIFPELAESEDERIRKTLINGFNKLDKSAVWYNGITNGQVLDWLERQAEHANFRNKIQIGDKVTRNEDGMLVNLSQLNRVAKVEEKQGEQKSDDKVELKFKADDFILNGDVTDDGKPEIFKVLNVRDTWYDVENIYDGRNTIITFKQESSCRLWDLTKDVKDGDVLACPNDAGDRDVVFIFKNINSDEGWVFCFCASDANGCFCTNNDYVGNSNSTNISPATKEQRNLLFQKMKEAGYEWDAEKKELKKIEQKPANKIEPIFNVGDKIQYLKGCGTIMTIEKIENGEYIFANNMGHTTIESGNKWYLVEQTSAEWSEEDEDIINKILCICDDFAKSFEISHASTKVIKEDVDKIDNWLTSLKDRVQPQPKQEWSKEDEKHIKSLLERLEGMCKKDATFIRTKFAVSEDEDWLKSIRPQSQWKPSDEQMNAFDAVLVYNPPCSNECRNHLITLYNELKKLREE